MSRALLRHLRLRVGGEVQLASLVCVERQCEDMVGGSVQSPIRDFGFWNIVR